MNCHYIHNNNKDKTTANPADKITALVFLVVPLVGLVPPGVVVPLVVPG